MEQGAEYYDKIYSDSINTSKYKNLYKLVAKLSSGSVLDIGCGTAPLQTYIYDYHGFDFSHKAIEIADNKNVWIGNAYDKKNYGDYDTYVLTEVLEHLDDYRVLDNIPSGKRIIFSVPSFLDESHLRAYNEKRVRERYSEMLDIESITRFDCVWEKKKPYEAYILLTKAIKK